MFGDNQDILTLICFIEVTTVEVVIEVALNVAS